MNRKNSKNLMYRVLIVTVVKDRPLDLEKTLNSISTQTYENIHHFVIDGSSNNQVRNLLTEKNTSKSISVLFETDTGIYEAMNKWAKCNFEFDLVCWLNAGDFFYSQSTVEKIVASYEKNKWKWSYGNMIFVGNRGEIWKTPRQTPFNYSLFRLGIKWVPHGSVFMSKEFLLELGDYRTNVGPAADQEFLIRAARKAFPHAEDDIVLVFEDGGISSHLQGYRREVCWHNFRVINHCCKINSEKADQLLIPFLVIFQGIRRLISRLLKFWSVGTKS